MELVQGRETTWLTRVIYEEGLLQGTQKVAVRNGCYYHCLDVPLMFIMGDKGSVPLLWSSVLLELERCFHFLWVLSNILCGFCFEASSRLRTSYDDLDTFLQDISKYSSFSMLPRDISQQIFNELVESHCLSDSSLEAFGDCALEVTFSCTAVNYNMRYIQC